MSRGLLSTGDAAKVCSVTPNTVLKWIKGGLLPAQRTPGGHYRIDPRDLAQRFPLRQAEGPVYCWEHNAHNGELLEECRECLVYRARALRCYQLAGADGSGRVCETACEDCDYFRRILGQGNRVAALVEDPDVAAELRSQAAGQPCRIEVVESEFALGRLVEDFPPDFLVVDCPSGVEQAEALVRQLRGLSRIQLVRAILAVPPADVEAPPSDFWLRLPRPLTARAICDCVNAVRDAT